MSGMWETSSPLAKELALENLDSVLVTVNIGKDFVIYIVDADGEHYENYEEVITDQDLRS